MCGAVSIRESSHGRQHAVGNVSKKRRSTTYFSKHGQPRAFLMRFLIHEFKRNFVTQRGNRLVPG